MEAIRGTKEMELIHKIKDDLTEIKMFFKHESDADCLFDDLSDLGVQVPGKQKSSSTFSEMWYAFEAEEKKLKAKGRTLQTMTKADWHSHLENVVPIVINFLRLHYLELIYCCLYWNDDWEDYSVMANVKKMGPRKQFKLYAKEVLKKSHCCIYLAYLTGWSIDNNYNISPLMAYAARVLVIELIIDSSTSCDSVKKMKKWAFERVDDRCDKFFEEYGVTDHVIGLQALLVCMNGGPSNELTKWSSKEIMLLCSYL